jgi:hypothetical protein
MLQYTHNLFEHDRIRKQAKLILIRLSLSNHSEIFTVVIRNWITIMEHLCRR